MTKALTFHCPNVQKLAWIITTSSNFYPSNHIKCSFGIHPSRMQATVKSLYKEPTREYTQILSIVVHSVAALYFKEWLHGQCGQAEWIGTSLTLPNDIQRENFQTYSLRRIWERNESLTHKITTLVWQDLSDLNIQSLHQEFSIKKLKIWN